MADKENQPPPPPFGRVLLLSKEENFSWYKLKTTNAEKQAIFDCVCFSSILETVTKSKILTVSGLQTTNQLVISNRCIPNPMIHICRGSCSHTQVFYRNMCMIDAIGISYEVTFNFVIIGHRIFQVISCQ